jgi:hypothetical protein
MLAPDDTDIVVPLNDEESARLHQLEDVVESNLAKFLLVGRALAEIRDRRLYRTQYPTFELYTVARFGVHANRAAQLIRSVATAEILLAGPAAPNGDAPLSESVHELTMRPLSRLQPELASECWRLACRITPQPNSSVVGKIVRLVEGAISQGNGGHKARTKRVESAATSFLRPIYLLARMEFPSAEVFVCHFDKVEQAAKCDTACKELVARCELILGALRRKFLELQVSHVS